MSSRRRQLSRSRGHYTDQALPEGRSVARGTGRAVPCKGEDALTQQHPNTLVTLGDAGGFLAHAEILLTVLGVIVLGVWAYTSWQRKRSASAPLGAPMADPKTRLAALSESAHRMESLERLIEEAREVTRLCGQEIETRAARLEQLLAEVDQRIATLSRLEEHAGDARGGAGHRSAEPLIESPRTAERSAERSTPMVFAAPTDALADRVFQMADAGHSALEIAKALQEQSGKIELILALRGGSRPLRRPTGPAGPGAGSSAPTGQSATSV